MRPMAKAKGSQQWWPGEKQLQAVGKLGLDRPTACVVLRNFSKQTA